jgi:hypothetical protein
MITPRDDRLYQAENRHFDAKWGGRGFWHSSCLGDSDAT